MIHRFTGKLATDGLLLFKDKSGPKQIGQVFVQNFGLNTNGSAKEDVERKANAEHIVLCWNMHELLLAQLKQMVLGGGTKDVIDSLDLLEKCGVDYRAELKERGIIQ